MPSSHDEQLPAPATETDVLEQSLQALAAPELGPKVPGLHWVQEKDPRLPERPKPELHVQAPTSVEPAREVSWGLTPQEAHWSSFAVPPP